MRRVLAVLALLTLTACGSTVQQAGGGALGQAAGGTGADSGLGGSTAGDSTGLGGAAGALAPGTDPASGGTAPGGAFSTGSGSGSGAAAGSGTSTGTGASTVTSGGSAGSGSAATGPQGPGVSATTIKVGLVAVEDPNAGNKAGGINTANVHNIDDTTRAVVDDLNKRGGIAGRKVELVVYKYPGNSTTNEQLQAQACEKFTRDNKVLASLSDLGDNAQNCFEKAGLVTIGGGHTGYGEAQYRRYPHLLNPGAFSVDDQVETVVRGLKAQGWTSPWNPITGTAGSEEPHVGVVAFDLPAYRNAVEKHSKPALAAAGVKKVQVFYIRPNLNDGQADAQAAVLKFKREGVSHVTFLDNSGGLLELVFATNANSQGYFPRFGCDSGSCNQIVAEQMPASSLRGAVLVGWSPLNDVPASHDFVLPERKRCEKIMTDRGMAPFSRNDLNVMANVCQGVWFFEAAAKAAGPSLFADTILQGAFKIGRSFSPPATFAVGITPARHAGADAYRYAAWDTTCGGGSSGCFMYTGPVRRFNS